MGYLVYEMEAIQELGGEDRKKVENVKRELMTSDVKRSGYIPFFEPLGRGYFKKRLEKKRLIACRMDVPVERGEFRWSCCLSYLTGRTQATGMARRNTSGIVLANCWRERRQK